MAEEIVFQINSSNSRKLKRDLELMQVVAENASHRQNEQQNLMGLLVFPRKSKSGGKGERLFRVDIFSREHGPPHFRVTVDGAIADFRISDCAPLKGNLGMSLPTRRIYKYWLEDRQYLVDAWNKLRPSDCPVGPMDYPQEWSK